MQIKGMKLQLLGITIIISGVALYLLKTTYSGELILLISLIIGVLLSIIGFLDKSNH
jgi:hypothetical protein